MSGDVAEGQVLEVSGVELIGTVLGHEQSELLLVGDLELPLDLRYVLLLNGHAEEEVFEDIEMLQGAHVE